MGIIIFLIENLLPEILYRKTPAVFLSKLGCHSQFILFQNVLRISKYIKCRHMNTTYTFLVVCCSAAILIYFLSVSK